MVRKVQTSKAGDVVLTAEEKAAQVEGLADTKAQCAGG